MKLYQTYIVQYDLCFSDCRCDDIIFVFLYVVFGITYMCIGKTSHKEEIFLEITCRPIWYSVNPSIYELYPPSYTYSKHIIAPLTSFTSPPRFEQRG